MSTLGRLTDPDQFADIILKTTQGTQRQGYMSIQVVRLRDVGRVELGAQMYDQTCRLDGRASVALAVFQLPGSNAMDVAEKIKAKMRELGKSFPEGLDLGLFMATVGLVYSLVSGIVLVNIAVRRGWAKPFT